MKSIEFLSENFQFLVVKFSIYLNMRVFVMLCHLRELYDNLLILYAGKQGLPTSKSEPSHQSLGIKSFFSCAVHYVTLQLLIQ